MKSTSGQQVVRKSKEGAIMYDKKLTLSNGVEIPQIALGTWLIDDGDVSEAVRKAVSLGYRHIDTAQAYGNERGVG